MFGRQDDNSETPKRRSGGILGFFAFLVTMFAAVLYLVALILQFINVSEPQIINTMRSVASTITMCIVGAMGWRFVRNRSTGIRVLYVLLILIVVACVVTPIVLQYLPEK